MKFVNGNPSEGYHFLNGIIVDSTQVKIYTTIYQRILICKFKIRVQSRFGRKFHFIFKTVCRH